MWAKLPMKRARRLRSILVGYRVSIIWSSRLPTSVWFSLPVIWNLSVVLSNRDSRSRQSCCTLIRELEARTAVVQLVVRFMTAFMHRLQVRQLPRSFGARTSVGVLQPSALHLPLRCFTPITIAVVFLLFKLSHSMLQPIATLLIRVTWEFYDRKLKKVFLYQKHRERSQRTEG